MMTICNNVQLEDCRMIVAAEKNKRAF